MKFTSRRSLVTCLGLLLLAALPLGRHAGRGRRLQLRRSTIISRRRPPMKSRSSTPGCSSAGSARATFSRHSIRRHPSPARPPFAGSTAGLPPESTRISIPRRLPNARKCTSAFPTPGSRRPKTRSACGCRIRRRDMSRHERPGLSHLEQTNRFQPPVHDGSGREQAMIARGYVAEGYGPGPMPVAMCAPSDGQPGPSCCHPACCPRRTARRTSAPRSF